MTSFSEGVAPGPSLPTAAAAPLQRVRWKWSQTTNTWVPLSLTTSPPPSHQGQSDGEEFEDTYSQSTDPTVKPFLRSGQEVMGHSAARKQMKGTNPLPREIRVDSVKRPDSRSGSGAHEVVPTNYGGKVALSGNPTLIGLQSGFRTSTDLQLFRRTPDPEEKLPLGTIEVGAHTGFAPKPQGHGSTHTKGQGPGHDKLRETTLKIEKETDPFLAVNELGLTHIETEPTGIEILQSPYLTDLLPNDRSIGKLGPPVPSGTPQDLNRLALAQDFHKRRETVKDRLRSIKRKHNRGRSPSPPRTDIDNLGEGGGYVSTPSTLYPLFPLPNFEGSPSSFEFSANLSGWISAPQRRGYEFTPHLPTSLPTITPSTSVSPTTMTPSLTTATPTLTIPTPTLTTMVTGKRKALGTSSPTLRRSERLKKKLKPN